MQTISEVRSRLAEVCRRALETALYTAGIYVYAQGVRAASLRNPKARKMIRGHREIFTRLREALGERPEGVVWVHTASLGEFEQGRPVMEELRRLHPEKRILLTFFSPSGYEVRKDWGGADVVVYLPFDTPRNVARFLDCVRPEMAIFVKYEFWRNYLHALHDRKIPTYLISAVFRPEQAFFKRRSAWYRYWLRLYSGIFVQDERSRRLLEGVGISNVTVAGDTRFDRVSAIMQGKKEIRSLRRFAERARDAGKPVFIAGSSWPADEKVYREWVRDNRLYTIIAPHEFDTERLARLKTDFPASLLLSEADADPAKIDRARTLIIDCFGLLSSAYQYADLAYVGGGFGAGLHNINEAAVYGIPVLYGPNNRKFIEARELAAAGGGFEVADEATFRATADTLLDAPARKAAGTAAASYIRSKLGATALIARSLF